MRIKYFLIFVKESSVDVDHRTTLVKTLSNRSVSKGLNGFVLECSVKVIDVLLFKDWFEDYFFN